MGQQAPGFYHRRSWECERRNLTSSDDASTGNKRWTQETKFLHTEEEIIENHPANIPIYVKSNEEIRSWGKSFPIQSFSPLAFYIWEDVVDRFYHQLSIIIFFLIEADGPFLSPYNATPGALRFFFVSLHGKVVRLSSWMKDRTDEGKLSLKRIRFATFRLTWVTGFSLFLSFYLLFLLDYDRFSSVSSILSGRIVNQGKPNCSSNVNTAIERERLSPTGTKIAKD